MQPQVSHSPLNGTLLHKIESRLSCPAGFFTLRIAVQFGSFTLLVLVTQVGSYRSALLPCLNQRSNLQLILNNLKRTRSFLAYASKTKSLCACSPLLMVRHFEITGICPAALKMAVQFISGVLSCMERGCLSAMQPPTGLNLLHVSI
jgi:hypothetical protein